MHENHPPTGDEKQASIDLAGCRFSGGWLNRAEILAKLINLQLSI
jgi:hypothetical protein